MNHTNLFSALRNGAVVTLFAAVTVPSAHGQQSVPAPKPALVAPVLLAANDAPESSSLSYSSSVGAAETDAAENFLPTATDSPQPPPRRYGRRPVYADSSHNADGSSKYTFFAGVGFDLSTGGTHNDLSTSYSFQAGGGRNFNKNFGVMLQFDWDNFGFNSQTLTNQISLYNDFCTPTLEEEQECAPFSSLGGTSHIWSFTLDPIYTFYDSDKFGSYVVGGVGFYHKVADFTTPATEEIDTYYGPIEYEANETIDDYTSNAVGFNGGIGLTYKPSRFGGEKFYAEARYVFVDNQPRPGYTLYDYNNNLNSSYSGTNFFPQNSSKTTYIPIKFGIRF